MGTEILACSRLGEPRRCNQGVQRPITGDRVLDSRLMRVIAILTLIGLLGTASESRARQDSSGVEQLAQEGWTAVQAERFGDALTAFNTALESAPREPTLWLGAGAAAFMLGRDDQAQAALEQALDLNPQLVEAARFLGELYHRRGQVERAITLYADALAVAPDDAHLAEKLEDWEREDAIQSRFHQSRGAHFRVLFEGPTDDALARRIVEMLDSAYRDVGAALRTYPSVPINVVLYTQEQFQDLTRLPAWAGAAYDGQIRVPVQGAMKSGRRAELRRVLTHEYVHAMVAQLGGRMVPVWLNEGLATALEPGGVDRASATVASVSGRPSLRSLHGSFAGLAGAGASIAYAHSALAVDRMIGLRGASAVVLLLKDLAQGASFDQAFHQRIAVRYDEFDRMVKNQR